MDQTPHPHPPAIRPAPRLRWTPARQARFLAALLHLGHVRPAARAVGMSASSAHRLRQRLTGTDFDRNWDEALMLHDQWRARPLALEQGAFSDEGR